MKVNTLQKINAIWFLILDCVAYFRDKDIKYIVSILICLIAWHIIFSDNSEKKCK
jgi:hypothetical protein